MNECHVLGGRPLGTLTALISLSAITACGGRSEEEPDELGAVSEPASPVLLDHGTWASLPFNSGDMLAVHGALLPPTGALGARLFIFGGSQFEPTLRNWVNDPANPGQRILPASTSRTSWHITGSLQGPAIVPPAAQVDDFFCSGHAHDVDGNLHIVGGNEFYPGHGLPAFDDVPATNQLQAGQMPSNTPPLALCTSSSDPMVPCHTCCTDMPHLCNQMINRHKCESHFTGTKSSWWFENANTRLVRAVPMARGRWYPTLLRLYTPPLYSMVALSGHVSADDPGGAGMTHRNDTIELLSSTLGGWTTNPQPLLTFETYPRAFVTPYAGGSIVVASPLSPDVDLAMPSTVLKPVLNQGQFQLTVDKLPGAGLLLRPLYWAFHTSAVLLPLRPSSSGVYPNGRILMTNDVQPIVMNLQELVPDWDDTAARRTPAMRMHANATLLATGDVLVTGGTSHIVNDGWDVSPQRPDQSVRFAEVYREDINRWDEDSGPPAAVPRQYHSIALLLPDGSVLTAGGSKHEKFSRSLQYGPLHEGRVQQTEFFLPWYTQFPACPATPMCRPTIGDSTPEPPRAGNWTITTGAGTPGTSIKRVALIAPGSVTHSFNVDQRYVELRIVPQSATATTVRVVVPDNHYVLPSGWYMLVISRSSIPDGGTQENPRGKYVPSVAKWVRVP